MTEAATMPPVTTREGRAARGLGWQDTGPVLRNSRGGHPVDPFYLSLEEAVVWIATRDIKAVAGARAFMKIGEERLYPLDPNARWHADVAAQVLLKDHLRGDVAGHHHDCSSLAGERCNCAALKRKRYCRCEDAAVSTVFTCDCISGAQLDLHRALVEGLPAAGQYGDQTIYRTVEKEAFAGSGFAFRDDGLSLIPEVRNMRVLRAEVEKRWPLEADPEPAAAATLESELDQLLIGSSFQGRPADSFEGLRLFARRLVTGGVLTSRMREAEALSKLHSRRPAKETVSDWIGPFYKQIVWDGSRPDNAETLHDDILQHLIVKARNKTAGVPDKR